jgi:hypothetical protein
MIENLAVEDDIQIFARASHWLVTRIGEIQNRKSSVRESHLPIRGHPHSSVIRATVLQRLLHPAESKLIDRLAQRD